MMMTSVKRLHLKLSDADAAGKSQFLVEEALRLSGQDGGERLVVLRKLDLGHIDQDLNARATALLREKIANAVPASSENSARAEVIYFESAAAAQSALLEYLLRDIEPLAWFWPKAVPEWKLGNSGSILRLLVSLSHLPQGRIALARTLLRVIASGGLSTLLQKVSEVDAARLFDVWPGHAMERHRSVQPATPKSNLYTVSPEPEPSLRLPDALGEVFTGSNLELILSMPTSSAVRRWLFVALMPAAMRHLADDASAAVDFARRIELALAAPFRSARPSGEAAISESGRRIERHPQRRFSPKLVNSFSPHEGTKPVSMPFEVQESSLIAEQRSMAAGIFYLVRPLKLMAYGKWLKAHSREAELHHGLYLLREIAIRQRVAAIDPIWQILPSESDPSLDVSPWRVGLDRLLRRRCRMNLVRVVKRVGWLDIGLEHIKVRFPLEAADVRLRRQGFDIDSGFVPWLGRSLTFVYEDKG